MQDGEAYVDKSGFLSDNGQRNINTRMYNAIPRGVPIRCNVTSTLGPFVKLPPTISGIFWEEDLLF